MESPFLCSDWADRLGRTTGPRDEPTLLRHTQSIGRERRNSWSRHSVDSRVMNVLWFLFLWFGFHTALFVAGSNVVVVTLISIPTVPLEVVPTYLERERESERGREGETQPITLQ